MDLSSDIRGVVEDLKGRVDVLPDEIRGVQSAVFNKLEEFSASNVNSSSVSKDHESVRKLVAIVICNHILIRIFESNKSSDIRFAESISKYFYGVFSGYCHSLMIYKPCQIDLQIVGDSVAVRSLGDIKFKELDILELANLPSGPKRVVKLFYDKLGLDSSAWFAESSDAQDTETPT